VNTVSGTSNATNTKVPARMYYNKNRNIAYSIDAYIRQSTSRSTTTHFISNKNKWKTIIYGDKIPPKAEGICRIVSQNINCIGIDVVSNPKLHTAKEWLYHNEVDICGWQEIGVAQHLMQRHKKLAERMRDIRHNNIRISSSNNSNEKIEKFQYGGLRYLHTI